MKITEQKITSKKVKTEIVVRGNKTYIRESREKFDGLQIAEIAIWKRFKTNHQVKKEENETLEKEYQDKFKSKTGLPNHQFAGRNLMASGSTMINTFVPINRPEDKLSDKKRRELEKGIVEKSQNGNYKLAAVKYVKDVTGWGLKESKDFVDAFFERKNKFIGTSKKIADVISKSKKITDFKTSKKFSDFNNSKKRK